jgi:hypothetical protein
MAPEQAASLRFGRPLLLIDVDGVLNPFAARETREGFTLYQLAGFPVRLNPAHGAALRALIDRFDLVWATTWEDKANALIGPRVGLPSLPVIHFDLRHHDGAKWPDVARFVGDRPVCWLEDDPGRGEISWAQRRNNLIPTRIIKVSPYSGLMPSDLAVAERFYLRLSRGGAD